MTELERAIEALRIVYDIACHDRCDIPEKVHFIVEEILELQPQDQSRELN